MKILKSKKSHNNSKSEAKIGSLQRKSTLEEYAITLSEIVKKGMNLLRANPKDKSYQIETFFISKKLLIKVY
jgi:hypothetical protein